MAEIKSTLDLVLERTKNLSLTEEEKEALQRKEWEGKIRGWGQKYLDGLMRLSMVKTGMASIPENRRKEGRDILRNLALENLDTQGDPGKIFDLLEGILEESRAPYLEAIRKFQKTVAAEESLFLEKMRSRFADHGISGRAVIPNLTRDEAWKSFFEKARMEFRKSIALIHRDN